MTKKTTYIPGISSKRKMVDARRGKLSCEVSSRWIQFPDSSIKSEDIDYLKIDVMTIGSDEKDKKICELILDRDLLNKILNDLPRKNFVKNI